MLKRIAMIVAILALLALGGYISARQLYRRMRQDARIEAKASDTPSELASLLAGLKNGSGIGDIVFLREVRIEPGPAAGLFFAVDRKGSRMAVFSDASVMSSFSGRMANLSGSIVRFPSRTTMQRQWKLSKALADEMRQQMAYLRAERVWPAASARAHRP